MIARTLQDKVHGRKFIAKIPAMSFAAFSRILLAGLSLAAGAAHAQGGERGAADAALVERIRQAVIRELRESGALERAVDEGVERYVERQRAEAALRQQREAETRTAAIRPVSNARDHIRGNSEAPVTLIEYSDFECPFCKSFHATVKKLVEESGGQVRWVYRHFPLEELHPVKARREALASECAAELGGNDAFWKFADRFYELTPSNNRTDVDAVLPRIAREIGLDEARFASCLASGKHERRVQEDFENATATGGRGTPWSIVVSKRGKTYPLSGAQPYAAARELVERARRER